VLKVVMEEVPAGDTLQAASLPIEDDPGSVAGNFDVPRSKVAVVKDRMNHFFADGSQARSGELIRRHGALQGAPKLKAAESHLFVAIDPGRKQVEYWLLVGIGARRIAPVKRQSQGSQALVFELAENTRQT